MTRLSKSQINKLGERLRRTAVPIEADLRSLNEFVTDQDPIRLDVETAVRQLIPEAEPPTSRLKTQVSILEKLRRQHTSLFKMQDIAGVRLVTRGGRSEQDVFTSRLLEHWSNSKLYDRREQPQHGYRAVHVVVHVGERPVEIQVRTKWQHLWAEMFEKLADRWGRSIRYGGPPDPRFDPKDDTIPFLQTIADHIAFFEAIEQNRGLAAIGDSLAVIEREIKNLRKVLLSEEQ